jgi:hypothetical protein
VLRLLIGCGKLEVLSLSLVTLQQLRVNGAEQNRGLPQHLLARGLCVFLLGIGFDPQASGAGRAEGSVNGLDRERAANGGDLLGPFEQIEHVVYARRFGWECLQDFGEQLLGAVWVRRLQVGKRFRGSFHPESSSAQALGDHLAEFPGMWRKKLAQLVVGLRHEILVAPAADGPRHALGFFEVERRQQLGHAHAQIVLIGWVGDSAQRGPPIAQQLAGELRILARENFGGSHPRVDSENHRFRDGQPADLRYQRGDLFILGADFRLGQLRLLEQEEECQRVERHKVSLVVSRFFRC